MRILTIGGAGLMGSGTIRDLVNTITGEIEAIIAADSHQERLDKLASELDDPRLSTQVLDVADPAALEKALQGCDLCVNGVPTFAGHQMTIFEACLKARRSYVDYGGMGVFTVQQKAMHQAFVDAGVTAVIGLGADPGMSNVLCRAVADRLDTVEKINLYWTGTKLGPNSPALSPSYTLSTILAEYANPSQQFLDGELREVAPREGEETLVLPAPFGPTTFMFTQHSEPLTVPFAKGIAEKGIKEMTWRLAFSKADHEAYLALVRAGFGDYDTPVEVRGGTVKPLDVLQAVIARNVAKHPPVESECYDLHFAIGVGTRNGVPTTVTARVLGGPHPLYDDFSDAATSMNMSIGVQQILANPLVPGVWAPEEYFSVEPYLEEVRRRHFKVEFETLSVEAVGGGL
jgi:saccharopine dehydrogenase-like NADP-dependent oxidoreductase